MMYLCQFGQNQAIGSEIESRQAYMTLVILKIRSRSPKSNHFFHLSHISISASLVKIHLKVHKLELC